jgi:hypothetical protein
LNVLKRYLIGVAAAAFMTGAAAAQTTAADDSQTGSTDTRQTQPATTQDQDRSASAAGTTTLTGCVYKEDDVPGLTPNIAEQAGIMEDYILAVSAGSGETGATGTSGQAAGTSGAAAANMYKLEHADDEDLQAVVGKRVEVTGRVDAEEGDTGTASSPDRDESAGPDRVELPEFEVTSIREVGGDCPAQPAK